MQKRLYIFILASVLSSCQKSESSPEKRVYIVPVETHKTGENTEIGLIMQPKYFSLGFWKYFAKQFPQSYSKIFHSKIAIKQHTLPQKDPDFLEVIFDSANLLLLQHTLPKNAIQKENSNLTMNNTDKLKPTSKLKWYIVRDYEHFRQLLDDSINKPVFIFSEDFVKEIEQY